MNSLASLISVLGAGYAGYSKGTRNGEEMNQQDEEYASARDKRAYEKNQRDRELKLQKDVAASQKDIVLENGTTTTGTNVFTNPADAAYDNKEMRVNAQKVADSTGQDAIMPNAPAPVSRLGTQMFTDPVAAQQASIGINSESSKMGRAAKVYSEAGDIDKAKKYQDWGKTAITEGSDKLLTGIQSAAPSVDVLKKAKGGVIKSTVGKDNAETFRQAGGRWTVSDDTPVEYYLTKDPTGRDIVNARILGKDGKPVVDDVRSAGLMLADMKTRLEAEKADMNAVQAGKQIDVSREGQQLSYKASMAHVGIAQKQLEQNSISGQLKQKELVMGRPLTQDEKETSLGIDKLPALVRSQVTSLTKEQDANNAAMSKAMADGTWQPGSPGAMALTKQQNALSIRMQELIEPYQKANAASRGVPIPVSAKAGATEVPEGQPRTPIISSAATAARDHGISAFNAAMAGTSPRVQIMEQRKADVAKDFDAQLTRLGTASTRSEKYALAQWFDDHIDHLSNAQKKQLREAEQKTGL